MVSGFGMLLGRLERLKRQFLVQLPNQSQNLLRLGMVITLLAQRKMIRNKRQGFCSVRLIRQIPFQCDVLPSQGMLRRMAGDVDGACAPPPQLSRRGFALQGSQPTALLARSFHSLLSPFSEMCTESALPLECHHPNISCTGWTSR